MVAALLRAMGYHTPFVAPKGKDGGTPRIKVQVKHKPDTAICAALFSPYKYRLMRA